VRVDSERQEGVIKREREREKERERERERDEEKKRKRESRWISFDSIGSSKFDGTYITLESGGGGEREENLLRSFQKKGCPNLAVRAWKITVTYVCVRGGKR